eukprot:CAMPEP_0194265956 /NCGR_PEP_ID=MMETSP0169-20130528/1026_1 /TAXON_ID=218684 /ORGANISM="Corethron pennatum, Strain L29A3" /LENGTH=100 /DNA_ID=CAMNT_0039006533 /DNA_START=209 /DNA_END=511 /DNA_ORIENTATION=-
MNDPSVELSFDGAPDGTDGYVVDAPLPSSVSPTAAKVPPAISEEDEATEPEAGSVAEEAPEASPEGAAPPEGEEAEREKPKKKKKPFFCFPKSRPREAKE